MIKKGDIIIIVAVCLSVLLSFSVYALPHSSGETVIIEENSKRIFEGKLSEDKEIKLSGNTVLIENGRVSVINADCKNQVCVRHRKISKAGESIVCLPNRVIVEIK